MIDCDPQIVTATASEFDIRNRRKPQNFLLAERSPVGELAFIVENLPKDGKGCRGTWLFDEMMQHFGAAVVSIQGNWTYGDNLAVVNQLTAGGMPLEEAAKRGFTGKRAAAWGFMRVTVQGRTQGIPGTYSRVHVVFTH